MKFTLRDFFWLQVFAAIAICWVWDHHQQATRLKELFDSAFSSFFFMGNMPDEVSDNALARRAILRELRSLSNDELMHQFANVSDSEKNRRIITSSCYLGELARRKMCKELQELCSNSQSKFNSGEDWPADLQIHTALRRAQGFRDPLKINVEVEEKDIRGQPLTVPVVAVTLQNVDELDETIAYMYGGDYRGGRYERWRVRLADQKGRLIEDSNFVTSTSGGYYGGEKLKIGEKAKSTFSIDLRSYVKPPPPGHYTLQLINADRYIANEPNLDGLIVWTSDPIPVRVANPGPQNSKTGALPLLCLSLIIGAVLVVKHRRTQRKQLSLGGTPINIPILRDLVYLALIVVLTIGWLIDSRHLMAKIQQYQPDAEATWTIRAS